MKKIIVFFLAVFVMSTFFIKNSLPATEVSKNSYQKISQEKAAEMMKNEKDYIIIDVRTKAEYEEGHIKGAISLPNETIGSADIPELKDKDQIIMLYCRSGNRSRQAAQKLINKGYTNVYDFGAITTWKGEIVK